MHSIPAPGSGLREKTEEFCRKKEGHGPPGSPSDAGPPGSHCRLNKNVAHVGGKALDQELRGLGRVFVLLLLCTSSSET